MIDHATSNSQDSTTNQKYKKILNNLLNISYNDACIFANIDNRYLFDIYKKFGHHFMEQVLQKPDFSLSLIELDDHAFLTDLQAITRAEDVLELYKNYNEPMPSEIQTKLNKVRNAAELRDVIKQITRTVEINRQKNAFKWKRLMNEANRMNDQSNLWPLHLGLIYLTLKIDNKVVQAPLFLKEVAIKIQNSKVFLVALGGLKINEKLLYFLESNNYVFDVDFDYSQLSIQDLFDRLKHAWSQNLTLPKTIEGAVPNFRLEEIDHEVIRFWPGISLGFFEPTGGHLRKLMNQILDEGALDQILEVEFDKGIYKHTVAETIKKQNFGFYKIVASNLSQDRAIVSALNQNTIIWGPPGTGKSQTIANILVNILAFGKTALVVSQKKAALEVLKQRLGELRQFCLFILHDREMNKANFYKPLQAYLNYLENFEAPRRCPPLSIISRAEKQQLQQIHNLMQHPKATTNLLLYHELTRKNHYNAAAVRDILQLETHLRYDFLELKKVRRSQIGPFLARTNHYHKPTCFGLFLPKPIRRAAQIIKDRLIHLNFDLDLLVAKQSEIDITLMDQIHAQHQAQAVAASAPVNEAAVLQAMIANLIFQRLKALDQPHRAQYSQFALDVRAAHLDPGLFIKKHAEIIKRIYPVIITTPDTDLQAWGRREFDYALLDESSQIYLERGLPILYLAKIKILAGDDQQMQPSRWFAPKDAEGENPFGNIESILDYAIAKGVYAVLLDKNYRAKAAALMSFNSRVFYHGELDVIDSAGMLPPGPAIEVINANGIWENSQNQAELELLIAQAQQHLHNYRKIILLCFNISQQTALEAQILENYPELEQALQSQKLLVRNIENIQGDEAELVIMSVAYDRNTKLHATYVAKPGGKNALNVATSRAGQKMIIIKSIYSHEVQNPNHSPDIALFREWLRFLDLDEADKTNYVGLQEQPAAPRRLNHSTTEVALTPLITQLIQQIKLDLTREATNFATDVELVINHNIGSIKLPLGLLDRASGRLIVGIYLDDFSYHQSYDAYLHDRDTERFLRAKCYNLIRTNLLNWPQQKPQVLEALAQFYYQAN